MNCTRILAIVGLATAIINGSSGVADELSYQAITGAPHADFILPRIDNGRALRLSDYRGKKVLLVHFASW